MRPEPRVVKLWVSSLADYCQKLQLSKAVSFKTYLMLFTRLGSLNSRLGEIPSIFGPQPTWTVFRLIRYLDYYFRIADHPSGICRARTALLRVARYRSKGSCFFATSEAVSDEVESGADFPSEPVEINEYPSADPSGESFKYPTLWAPKYTSPSGRCSQIFLRPLP